MLGFNALKAAGCQRTNHSATPALHRPSLKRIHAIDETRKVVPVNYDPLFGGLAFFIGKYSSAMAEATPRAASANFRFGVSENAPIGAT